MKKILLCSTLLALAVGCSNDSSGGGRNVNPAQVADTGTQSDLEGNWSQACQAGAINGGGFASMNGASSGTGNGAEGADDGSATDGTGARTDLDSGANGDAAPTADADEAETANPFATTQNFLEVSNDEIYMVTKAFSSADCSGEAIAEARVRMDYEVESYQATANNEARMSVESAQMIMLSEEAADQANAQGLCGFSNWSAGQSRNIEGTDCLMHLPDNGQEFTQVFNYSGGNLSFGLLDESTAADRDTAPTTLGTVPFTRVAESGGDAGGDAGQGDQDQDQEQEQQEQEQKQQEEKEQDQDQDQDQDQEQEEKQQDQGSEQGQDDQDAPASDQT